MKKEYSGQFPRYEFSEIQRLNPYWSSYTCFAESIWGKKSLHPRLIRKWFDRLVEGDDYAKGDKNMILRFLIGLASKNKGKSLHK